MGVRARASTRSSLRVRVSVVNLAVAHKLNFRHHGAEMMGMPRPDVGKHTLAHAFRRTPTLPKKHQSNSNRGSPNNPPRRTTARPAPQGRMMQWQTRRRTHTRFWNPSSASHPRRRHTDPWLARNAHNCQHNQGYYHSRLIPANCAHTQTDRQIDR